MGARGNEIIKILSANVQGLRDRQKKFDVINYMKNLSPQILCLQDTHWINEDYDEIKKIWDGELVINGSKTNARGVAILFSSNFEYSISYTEKDDMGNMITLDFNTNNTNIRLITVYAPNKDNPEFFEELNLRIENSQSDYTIVCGDFNLTLNPELDNKNYININNPKSRQVLLEIMNKNELIDIYRYLNPNKKRYTWRKPNPLKQARLDFFIANTSIADIISDCSIKPSFRSDHSIIELDISMSHFVRHKSRWQLNTSLLKDKSYVDLINSTIQNELEFYEDKSLEQNTSDAKFIISPPLLLEVIIMRIREESIKYSAKVKHNKIKKEKELIKEIEILEQSDNLNLDKINNKKQILETIRKDYIEGSIVRSRIQWLNESEKPTKYFLSLENRNYIDKTIRKIIINDETVTNQDKILKHIKDFYQNLFKKHDQDFNEDSFYQTFNNLNIPKVNNIDYNVLEGKIESYELSKTLKNMKNNKTPGIDGLPAEFYKFFWLKLKNIISDALNYSYETGKLSCTLRQSLIICLPKGQQQREHLKNWRPLSMLSIPYKLLSGSLANRLKHVLDKIISPSQTGFITGRYIGDTTRLIYDIMHQTEQSNIDGLLMSIDFEKAFDSLSWKFLKHSLNLFNFGPSFKNWINIINNDITAYVIQCGKFSEPINIERGCRQGDPIAPYLFLLPAQLLNILIQQNPEIKGINIGGFEYKIAQFADDTTILLDGTQKSLQATLNVLEIFGTLSGLKMNSEKTKIVWLGRKKHSKDKLITNVNLNWNVIEFSLLGIHFHVDLPKMIDINYTNIYNKILKEIKNWRKRKLTPIGKITLIKSLFLSKANHLFSILPNPPTTFVKKLEQSFFQFIWDNKPDKIKRTTLMTSYQLGGLNMPNLTDFITSMKASWMRKLIKASATWIPLFEDTVCEIKYLFIYGNLWYDKMSMKTTNQFWKDVLNSYSFIIKNIKISSNIDIMESPIWYNSQIFPYEFHKRVWSRGGINFIKDLIDEDGKMKSFEMIQNSLLDIVSPFDYLRLTSAVNKFVNNNKKESLFSVNNPQLPHHIKILFKNSKGCKDFRDVINKSNLSMKFKNKWQTKLNITINEISWKQCFKILHFSINDNYYKYFQYKIVHRILGTNSLLYKIGISENNKCRLCLQNEETIEHLLIQCIKSQELWDQIKNWLMDCFNININFDPFTILFGYQIMCNMQQSINMIILIAKNYIFQMARKQSNLLLEVFLIKLKHVYQDQRMLAIINNKINSFEKTWSRFKNVLD